MSIHSLTKFFLHDLPRIFHAPAFWYGQVSLDTIDNYLIWHKLNESVCIMPHVMPHDLKRYSLQLACQSGVDAATLQALGDHASLQTTMDHYVCGNLDRYAESIRLPGKGGSQ